MKNSIGAGLVCLLLSGCGASNQPAFSVADKVQALSLSSIQKKVVRDGVREIVANAADTKTSQASSGSFKAFRLNSGAIVNVCGEVRYKMAADKPARMAPFFMEVAQKEGQAYAKRGQVGFDKLKKAKVVYLCNRGNSG